MPVIRKCSTRSRAERSIYGLEADLELRTIGSNGPKVTMANASWKSGRAETCLRDFHASLEAAFTPQATSATLAISACIGSNRIERMPEDVSVTKLPAGISCHLVSGSWNGSETRQ